MTYSGRNIPVIRRTDKFEVRLSPEAGRVRVVALRVEHGEIVASGKGMTLLRSDFDKWPETLEALLAVLESWRRPSNQLTNKLSDTQIEEMKRDAAARRHINQQRIGS